MKPSRSRFRRKRLQRRKRDEDGRVESPKIANVGDGDHGQSRQDDDESSADQRVLDPDRA